MNLLKVFSACVAVVSVCQGNAAPADTVVASSYGWNPTNATKCLQAALDSGAKKVIVDKQASEWLVDMMYPRSNTEIVFQDGVIVRARPGSMKRNIDNLFRCKNVSNIVMRGEGRAILRMNREDYFDRTRYMRGEHRHAVSLHNAQNMVVRDLTLEDSGGDGVYVLNVKKALLENLICSGHARQGTSIISADEVVVRNCLFIYTKGALPECGMDIEPGHAVFNIQRVLIDNCVMCSNNCSGVAINVSALRSTNQKMDVLYRNCKMFDNVHRGLWLVFASGLYQPVKGNLRFENCELARNGAGPLQVNNLASDALRVSFDNCVFDASGIRKSGVPISLVNGRIRDDLNNLSFTSCKLLNCPDECEPVKFDAMTGCGVLPGGARGVIDVAYTSGKKGKFDFATLEKRHKPKPELRLFETGTVDIDAIVPYKPGAKPEMAQKSAGYRAKFTFLQYVKTPGKYIIRFKSTQIGKATQIDIPVVVYDKNGTPHDTFNVTQAEYDYILDAQSKETIYRFEINPNGRRVMVTSDLAGNGVVANGRVHWLTGDNQDIYFEAKAGGGDVKLELTMEPSELVSAELIDPNGKVVDSCVNRGAGTILVGKRPQNAPSEIWQLHVTRFVDDCLLRLGAGTSGIYSYDKNMLLIEKNK